MTYKTTDMWRHAEVELEKAWKHYGTLYSDVVNSQTGSKFYKDANSDPEVMQALAVVHAWQSISDGYRRLRIAETSCYEPIGDWFEEATQ